MVGRWSSDARLGAEYERVTSPATPVGDAFSLSDLRLSTRPGPERALEAVAQVSREPLVWAAVIVCATGAAVALRHPISAALGTGAEAQPLVAGPGASAQPTPTVTWSPAAAAAAGLPLPTHAPRDPFQPLLKVDLLPQTGAPGNAWVGVTGGGAGAVSGPVAGTLPGATPATDSTVGGSTSLVPSGSRKPVPTAASKATATGPGNPGAVATPSGSGRPARSTPVDTGATRGACQVVHVVMQGESLWRIAQVALHTDDVAAITAGWHKIYDANRALIGSNPDLLRTGTQLCMPTL